MSTFRASIALRQAVRSSVMAHRAPSTATTPFKFTSLPARRQASQDATPTQQAMQQENITRSSIIMGVGATGLLGFILYFYLSSSSKNTKGLMDGGACTSADLTSESRCSAAHRPRCLERSRYTPRLPYASIKLTCCADNESSSNKVDSAHEKNVVGNVKKASGVTGTNP